MSAMSHSWSESGRWDQIGFLKPKPKLGHCNLLVGSSTLHSLPLLLINTTDNHQTAIHSYFCFFSSLYELYYYSI